MDTLKKPVTLVTVFTLSVIIGAVFYIYKQNKLLQDEMVNLDRKLTTTIGKVPDLSNFDDTMKKVGQSFSVIHNVLKNFEEKLEDCFIEEDNQQSQLIVLKDAILNLGGEVKTPQTYSYSKRFNGNGNRNRKQFSKRVTYEDELDEDDSFHKQRNDNNRLRDQRLKDDNRSRDGLLREDNKRDDRQREDNRQREDDDDVLSELELRRLKNRKNN